MLVPGSPVVYEGRRFKVVEIKDLHSVVIADEAGAKHTTLISLDHPGALSTGLCMLHAILPKDQFLAELGLSHLQWPCWGKMRTIHKRLSGTDTSGE
jgi:hypothetical protein